MLAFPAREPAERADQKRILRQIQALAQRRLRHVAQRVERRCGNAVEYDVDTLVVELREFGKGTRRCRRIRDHMAEPEARTT